MRRPTSLRVRRRCEERVTEADTESGIPAWRAARARQVGAVAFRTIIEPFRIHSVEPLLVTSQAHRREALQACGLNLFGLHARRADRPARRLRANGAMSRELAAVRRQRHGGRASWYVFLEAVQELFPFRHVIPTHQGRAAENILHRGEGPEVVPNNKHSHLRRTSSSRALPRSIGRSRRCSSRPTVPLQGHGPSALRLQVAGRLRCSDTVTIDDNSGGGQPVSLEYLRGVRAICDPFGALFLDACRFAENAWFIREARGGPRPPQVAYRSAHASLADGMTMSARRTASNIGGRWR